MDKKAFKLAARLSAIEYMIADLFKKFYAMSGTPYKEVAKEHDQFPTRQCPISRPAK